MKYTDLTNEDSFYILTTIGHSIGKSAVQIKNQVFLEVTIFPAFFSETVLKTAQEESMYNGT